MAAQAVGVTLMLTEFSPHQYEDAFARISLAVDFAAKFGGKHI